MHLLFTRFPLESADGGAENQTSWLMEGLRARGHILQYVGSCPVLLQRARELKIENSTLNIGPPPVTKFGAISFLWRKIAMKRALMRAIEALPEKPEAIFMLSLTEKLLLSEWVASKGIRVFWIEHDRIGPWLRWNPWLRSLKRAAQHATIVCVSEVSRKLYLKMGFDPKKVIAIPNGVPIPGERIAGSDKRLENYPLPTTHYPLHVGTVARLDPEKGIDVLIQSIEKLPEVTLSILGKGRLEGYIRTLIEEDTKRMGQQRIHLLPRVPDLPEFYRSLDLFVLPSSDHDPFGLVAAEAMVLGVPTIVTDACGISGHVKNGEDALIVSAGSPQELGIAIKKLFDEEKRSKLSLAGIQAIRGRLGVPHMIEQYEEVLQK